MSTSVVVFRSDPPKGGSRAGQKLITEFPSSKKLLLRPKGYSNKPIA